MGWQTGRTALVAVMAAAVLVIAPAGVEAQQARALQGTPIAIPQIQRDANGITVSVPGLLPAIRVPNAMADRLPIPRGPVQPQVIQPQVIQPAPMPAPWAPAAAPEAPSEAAELPAVPSGEAGRTYGVFVGISDYPSQNDLDYCADDAIRVQQAFVNAGILSPLDSVVLRDRQATRTAVASSIERFARRMGPNDTLVFFFSGHGNRVADRSGDERDGQDETIVLADGPVLDDDLAQMLAPTAGRAVAALDSCYSGGFQQDLARLPNTAGLYASREDQVSYVANRHQAGGYLSYHLAEVVSRSQGRPMTLGMLHRDLSEGFARSGTAGRQDLTLGVSRSVNYRSVLFQRDPEVGPTVVAAR
ncbi:MAG: caspase domain-containing protein [Sandaracinaceae bacterium]